MKTIADLEMDYYRKAYGIISNDLENKRSELKMKVDGFSSQYGILPNQFLEQTNQVRQKAQLGFPSAMSYISNNLDKANTPENNALGLAMSSVQTENEIRSLAIQQSSFGGPSIQTPILNIETGIQKPTISGDILGDGRIGGGTDVDTNSVLKFATKQDKQNLNINSQNKQVPLKDKYKRIAQPSYKLGRPQ